MPVDTAVQPSERVSRCVCQRSDLIEKKYDSSHDTALDYHNENFNTTRSDTSTGMRETGSLSHHLSQPFFVLHCCSEVKKKCRNAGGIRDPKCGISMLVDA